MRSRVVAVVKFENELTKKKIYIAKIKNKNKIFKKILKHNLFIFASIVFNSKSILAKIYFKIINNIQSNNMTI